MSVVQQHQSALKTLKLGSSAIFPDFAFDWAPIRRALMPDEDYTAYFKVVSPVGRSASFIGH